jgi:LysM repeat protein
MKTFKLLTLLFLGAVIFGSTGYFSYELFIKPSRVEREEKALQAAAPLPTPTPDPALPEFQRLKSLQGSGKLTEARDGWALWISKYTNSRLLHEARQQLGAASMALLFQPDSTHVVSYTVVKGDSLARIASKHQSNAELIQKANELPNINLQIGQQLVIPALQISIELDRLAKKLTLLNNGIFLKEYSLLSTPLAPKQPETRNSKVLDKVATSGTKRIAFGDKAYPESERSILLIQAPAIIAMPPLAAPTTTPTPVVAGTSTNAPTPSSSPSAAPSAAPFPGGYVLSPSDLLEIFPLVSRNTPVIIH